MTHLHDCPHGDPNECACERAIALWWLAAWRAAYVARFYAAGPKNRGARSSFDIESRRRYALHRHEKSAKLRARGVFLDVAARYPTTTSGAPPGSRIDSNTDRNT